MPHLDHPAFNHVTVTPAAGSAVVLTVTWKDADGVEHSASAPVPEDAGIAVPPAIASTLRAEGVIPPPIKPAFRTDLATPSP